LTLAAYNAGPAAVDRWVPPQSMEAAIWIENIPYNETRGYVQHIVEHIVAFAYVRERIRRVLQRCWRVWSTRTGIVIGYARDMKEG